MPARRSILLTVSLAALLAVAAASAWFVWDGTRDAQERNAELHSREMRTQAALGEVRSGVYLMAILARDAMLDATIAAAPDYIAQFDAIKTSTGQSLQLLQQVANTDAELTTVQQLRLEVEGYWASTRDVLANPTLLAEQRTEMLRGRGVRRREILRLAGRIGEMTVESGARERARIEEENRSFRASLGWTAALALLAGVGISAFTLIRMRTLEDESETAATALRSLSGQLRTAQEQERKSLSRELHDQVGQMLTGLRMELSAFAPPVGAPERVSFDRAKATVEQTLGIVRNIAMLLRPSMLDDLGLTPALIWLTREVNRTSNIEIRRNIDARVDRLPDAHRTCLFRVVQEALTNVSRHSGARTVDLDLSVKGGFVLVRVSDDGKGFDISHEREKGLGLLGMRERVRELGGEFQISSIPGRGTTIEIRLPQPATLEAIDDQSTDSGRPRNRQDRIKTAV